jgi:tetratricopeptide (TPR) repeat protein
MTTKIQQAIDASLQCLWDEAIDLNLDILTSNPTDIATLNRLAKCYLQLGDKKSAKETYQKVLELDKYNAVALKNLKTLNLAVSTSTNELAREDFIESPGYTRTSSLIKVAGRDVLATLSCKQTLLLKPKVRLISVTTTKGVYVGTLPDDLSLKIKKLLDQGYSYQVCLKSATDNMASIFIREIKRPNKKNVLPSFNRAFSRH